MESAFATAVGKSARDAFESGLYCAESVVLAIAKARGLEVEALPRMATAFCGGMARTCGPCGAVTGGLMGIGLALGRNTPGESVQDAYGAAQRLMSEFEEEFGSCNCLDLLGCDLGTPGGQAMFQARGLRARCLEYTGRAAEIAARLIDEPVRS